MKAVKRFFKRKKKGSKTKAETPSSPPKPILKSSMSDSKVETPTPDVPARTISAPKPKQVDVPDSPPRAAVAPPSTVKPPSPVKAPPSPEPPAPVPPISRFVPTVVDTHTQTSHSNGSSARNRTREAPTPFLPTTSTDSEEEADLEDDNREGLERQGSYNYKGVSSSFQNGVSQTQRFGMSGTIEYTPAEDPSKLEKVVDAYESIPILEQTKLPRGGISMETKAVGRVQFGIPPETIKDSMTLGIPIPQVYIVPAERFCREMGPALGVNLAEFEFPAYFNFFVYKKSCTLVVDSQEAEDNICRVFNETLLGPNQFRREDNPIPFEEEDFSPSFPRDAIPNLEKELRHFRIMPDGTELAVDTLLKFCQFKNPGEGDCHDNLGVPPNVTGEAIEEEELDEEELEDALNMVGDEEAGEDEDVPVDEDGVESRDSAKKWSYKKARWVGDVATVWPTTATEEEKRNRTVPRVEIFKMPSGTEYIIHDIDVNNVIVGKARFSGHVKVSETLGIQGFGGRPMLDDGKTDKNDDACDDSFNSAEFEGSELIPKAPPSFHPPSFGLTTLGNSSGFDNSGSVSGYVLWVNGRGIMIDPPPYSSATLEREGIRPRTIVGIILTHCHADHDAGAFQKVLTGSPVVVITTPTIYKSFIRKYAALASLSPTLLRHSHRYKPAIIGEPLRFQGATFHFTYSLHTIPCVGFRVEWRGRSMVFTGDHMNKPDEIDRLQKSGVLSKGRADDLRNLPLQETDLLLHEAGAPPVHTPLDVLMKLPNRVKKRLYVVHTATLPKDCDLQVAPTGTAGTLRLDQIQRTGPTTGFTTSAWMDKGKKQKRTRDAYSISLEDDDLMSSPWSSASNEYAPIREDQVSEGFNLSTSFAVHQTSKKTAQRTSLTGVGGSTVPLVSLRPASSTDAWFILNLLSAVPFLSSLSYAHTMEVLETARVDAYCKNDVIVPASRRSQLLCVVWEGTCVERDRSSSWKQKQSGDTKEHTGAVWHAGDWTGPISLQPERRLSGESDYSYTHDIVASANEGVKVITIDFNALHQILKSGSQLYSKYLARSAQQRQQRRQSIELASHGSMASSATQRMLGEALVNLNVLELLDQNSALRKLSAVQKRHLESLAEGPEAFGPGERLWRSGAPVDKAFLLVSGTASFVPRRRNAGSNSAASIGLTPSTRLMLSRLSDNSKGGLPGEDLKEMPKTVGEDVVQTDSSDTEKDDMVQLENLFSRASHGNTGNMSETNDFTQLSENLQQRADLVNGDDPTSDMSIGDSVDDSASGDSDTAGHAHQPRRSSLSRRRSSRARFANKVLGRLYSRRAFTGGLVFSRGHFLGDVSKMVAGLLSSDYDTLDGGGSESSFPAYGFGDKIEGAKETAADNLMDMVIQEQEGNNVVHSSTLTAGKDGCVVLVFPREALIPFLDDYPGLLLSLLGTQVVV